MIIFLEKSLTLISWHFFAMEPMFIKREVMTRKYLLALLVLLSLLSCEKSEDENYVDELTDENVIPSENYIKANIDSRELIIYEDNLLNVDSLNAFSFSFGQSITKFDNSDIVDTCFTISGYLNKEQLRISFPMEREAGKYDVIRRYGPYSKVNGFYSNTVNFEQDQGFLTFETTNFLKEDIPENKIGEIEITLLDWSSSEIAGKFFFKAYGYYDDWQNESISATDSTILITKGSFFYHWSENLKIGLDN